MIETTLNWENGMTFEADTRGHKVVIDALDEVGGENRGMNPKEMLLNAVCGCTAMDVISILRKMRQEPTRFWISAEADKTSTIPAYFSAIRLTYHFVGELEEEKLIKAANLSMTKYCGVSYMVSKSAKISYQLELNGAVFHHSDAQFGLPA